MKECAVTNKLVDRRPECREQMHQYYSVEFSINGLDHPYLFKIWNVASMSMSILVKEDSDILPLLKVGETLNMKYYSTCSVYPPDYLETAIRHITKNDHGQFKGHYFVGLEILESQD